MRRKISITLLVFVLIFASFSCKKKMQVKGVDLEVSFSETPLSDNLITEIQYKWKTASDFERKSHDYYIFVHFWHNNNMLFQDDHIPEVQTSKWEPENEYTYSRKIHIPTFIDEWDPEFKGKESLRLSVGFYSPYDRSGKSSKKVFEKKIKIFPPPLDTPEVIYDKEGWYDLEVNSETVLKQWRWTSKEARCIIDNPHRDALLVIRGGVNLAVLGNQKVILKINDKVLDEFIPEESYFEKSYDIKKEMLGDEDPFYLVIATDRTFTPAQVISGSTDERELGVQISLVYFR